MSEYSKIGINKLYEMINEPFCSFVLCVGKEKRKECGGLCRGAHGKAYEYGHYVDKGTAGGVGQTTRHPALFKQVAEEEHA